MFNLSAGYWPRLNQAYLNTCLGHEDEPVIRFLKQNFADRKASFLDVACGAGFFVQKLSAVFPQFQMTGLDINFQMVDLTRQKGIKAVKGNILKLPFQNETFQVVHASHIIEHLGYPNITRAIDEMFRVLATNGYLIIRSPLFHPTFYDDLSHVRPYPPDSVTNYFFALQQSKKGKTHTKEVYLWYRREALQIPWFDDSLFVHRVNDLLKLSWIHFKLPRFFPNGYVLILQKL